MEITRGTFIKLLLAGGATLATGAPGCGGNMRSQRIKLPGLILSDSGFLRVRGRQVFNEQGKPFYLRGVALGNNTWEESPRIHDWILKEEDFAQMKRWGMNAVRYTLNYRWFEDNSVPYEYKEQGFRDLEERLNWAREHGIYVILCMGNAQGGNQVLGEGNALWTDRDNQNRLISLWREIARRYKDDPIVAGYELLNEPHPPQDQDWQVLAEEVAQAIREEDNRHILIVCNTLITNDNDWAKYPFRLFKISDDNVLYTAHIYDPGFFTHQGAFWSGIRQGAYFPDNILSDRGVEYKGGYYENPSLTQDSDWQYLQGNWADFSELTGNNRELAGQVLFRSTNERGDVWIDNVVLEEKDPHGNIRQVPLRNSNFEIPLYIDLIPPEWTQFQAPPAAKHPSFWDLSDVERVSLESGTIHLRGGNQDYAVSARLLNNYYIVRPGHQYRVSGRVKGENLGPADPSGGDNRNAFMINVFQGKTSQWDESYLERRIKFFADWAYRNGVPLYIGEFGTMPQIEDGRQDDLRWTESMLRIMNDLGIHWTYFQLRGSVPPLLGLGDLIEADPTNPASNPNYWKRQDMIDLLSRYAQSP